MTKFVYPISSVTDGSKLKRGLIRLYTDGIYGSVLCASPSDWIFFLKFLKIGPLAPLFWIGPLFELSRVLSGTGPPLGQSTWHP